MGIPKQFVKLGIFLSALVAAFTLTSAVATATPQWTAPAGSSSTIGPLTATTCKYTCVEVQGSGNHINRVETWVNTNPRFVTTYVGFLEVRWFDGWNNHYPHTGVVYISNQWHTGLDLNVNVYPNSLVCGRVWVWTGSTYVLLAGEDWKCIQTHP